MTETTGHMVTKGCWEDYRIIAVFQDEAAARRFYDEKNLNDPGKFSGDGYDVETISLHLSSDVVEPTSDHAVCDACGWEGSEDNVIERSIDSVVPDRCPRCRQFAVNYFIKPSTRSIRSPGHHPWRRR